jgi:PAS domain S-box-containing protein
MHKTIHVLILEDNENDAILEIDELVLAGFDIVYERMETRQAMKDALRDKTWDCIISDYSMPQFSGLDALAEFKKTNLDIPFILISGTIGEETAVAAMKAGAHDYIMKTNLKRLVPAFERELREAEVRRQKRQMEEAMRYERMLLRTLIDNLPDLIYIKDKECRKMIANKADIEFAGYTSESEIVGKTDPEIFAHNTGMDGYADDLTILQTGQPVLNREEDVFDAKGNQHWMLTTKMPIRNEQGDISGLVSLGHDITDRKMIEFTLQESEQNLKKQNIEYQTLNKEYLAINEEYLAINEELTESLSHIQKINAELMIAKNKAEESDKLKSAFLANMSHEVRTPLNAILGFSRFLKDSDITKAKTNQFVDIIQSSGQQLLAIINDILDISIIEANQITISLETVYLNKLLVELLQQFKKQAELKNIELLLSSSNPKEDVFLKTDINRLRQILCNLLNNAIKFTHVGNVEFGLEIRDREALFFVKDTGIGISPEYQSIIFKPFRQVESTQTRNYGGNGLGLSISKALVEKLGGTLTLISAPSKGSTFIFSLPYVAQLQAETRSEYNTKTSLTHHWDKHLILIAEDELYNYRYMEEILSSTHVKTLHAWNGMEAVEFVKEYPEISLILMDIKMPKMDGYMATRLIKEMRPQLPVIAQTAYALSEDKAHLKAEFDSFLSKPVAHDFFIEIIGSYLD